MLDTTPNNQFTLDLVITHLLNEESCRTMVDMDNICNNNILYAKGKEGKRNFSCYQCRKRGHLHSKCPNKTYNNLSSSDDSLKSEGDQRMRMKAEQKEKKKKKEQEKLVAEVAAAAFAMYAPSD